MEDLNKLDKEKLEEMRQNYDPKSEDVFKEAWDLSDTSEDDTIVKELYKEISNLKIVTIQNNNNSESSTNTVIEEKKKKNIQKAKIFLNLMLLVLPSQGDRSTKSSIPLGWRAQQSLILQQEQKHQQHLHKLRQANTNTDHKLITKKTAHVRTVT